MMIHQRLAKWLIVAASVCMFDLSVKESAGVEAYSTFRTSRFMLHSLPEKTSTFHHGRCVSRTHLRNEPTKETSLFASRDDNLDMFKPGKGPAVILDDPPTKIYERAIIRTIQWITAAAVFGLGIWNFLGRELAEEFFAGYLIEQSLSVDNLFVFLLLFDFFKVPLSSQDRVLNWGIFGAIFMRAIMIGLGTVAIQQFHAILLVFAGVLIYSSAKVLLAGDEDDDEDMNDNQIVQFSRKLVDSVDTFDGDRFFTVVDGVKKATPLLLCMVAVEISDVVFAVDSIPAVFGVTEVSYNAPNLDQYSICATLY